jgi:uncharacterized protein (TIGR03086 family)
VARAILADSAEQFKGMTALPRLPRFVLRRVLKAGFARRQRSNQETHRTPTPGTAVHDAGPVRAGSTNTRHQVVGEAGGDRGGAEQGAEESPMTVIDDIDAALAQTSEIVGTLTPDRLTSPSPCPNWDVRTELNHLVGGMCIFAAQLTGTEAGGAHEDDWLGDDPVGAYRVAAELDRAAWHRPGSLDRPVRLSFGVLPGPVAALVHRTEVLVHGVDLAVATDVDALVDQQQCAQLLATMCAMDFDAFRRPGMFGAALAPAEDDPAHRRLLAFLGRQPAAA